MGSDFDFEELNVFSLLEEDYLDETISALNCSLHFVNKNSSSGFPFSPPSGGELSFTTEILIILLP